MDDGCWTTVAEVLVIREGAPELVVGNEFVAPFRLGAMSPGKTVITNPDGNVIVVVPSGFLTNLRDAQGNGLWVGLCEGDERQTTK